MPNRRRNLPVSRRTKKNRERARGKGEESKKRCNDVAKRGSAECSEFSSRIDAGLERAIG